MRRQSSGGLRQKPAVERPESDIEQTAFQAGSRAALEQLEKISRGEAKSKFRVADYALLGVLLSPRLCVCYSSCCKRPAHPTLVVVS